MLQNNMNYAIQHLAKALQEARKESNLSQRALSLKTGITQAQISKIENGVADPKLSSLIELSRSLDVELMLVPRRSVVAVESVINLSTSGNGSSALGPAYSLDDDD